MSGLVVEPVIISDRLMLTTTLSFAATGLTVVVGNNGAGKSTLLDVISGVLPGASCSLDGERLDTLTPAQRAARMSSLGSSDGSDDRITVIERVRHGFYASRRSDVEETTAAAQVMRALGIDSLSSRPLSQLSRGQLRRVHVAKAMLDHRPRVVLLDEPLAGVDPGAASLLCALLRQRSEHAQVVVVMHDVLWALQLATRIIGMAHGRVVFDGPPSQLDDAAQQLVWPGAPWRVMQIDNKLAISAR